jgi:hypothetical protein
VKCAPGALSGRRSDNSPGVMIQLLCLVRMGTAYCVRRRINYYDAMLMNTERGGWFSGYQILFNGLQHEISSHHNHAPTLRNLQVYVNTVHAVGYASDTDLAASMV